MKTLDANDVITSLRRVVEKRGPGYIYRASAEQDCQNFELEYDEDRSEEIITGPSCIVGHVLFDLFDVSDLSYRAEGSVYDTADELERSGVALITPLATTVLAIAQDTQDKVGKTWGEALEAAEAAEAVFDPDED